LRQGGVGKCQALTHRYRCRRMVQPDHNNRHAYPLPCPRGLAGDPSTCLRVSPAAHRVCTKYDARTMTNPPTVAWAALVPCQPKAHRPPSSRAYMSHARSSGSDVRLQCRYAPCTYLAHTEPVMMPCVNRGKPSSSALALSSSSSVSDGKW